MTSTEESPRPQGSGSSAASTATAVPDFIIIGSGINALVCGAMLSLGGRRVLLLEREAVAGGCIRTAELTAPGFHHDVLSTLYPQFVSAPHFPQLAPHLARHGVVFRNGPTPTGVLLDDGRSLVLTRDREANIKAFEACAPGDGRAYADAMASAERDGALVGGLLGNDLWSFATVRLMLSELRKRGVKPLAKTFGGMLRSSRAWLEQDFTSPVSRALFAPWVLHAGLGPESAASAMMDMLMVASIEQAGSPMVEGGSARLVEAFIALITEQGGKVRLGVDVERIVVENGRAIGVRTADGEVIRVHQGVIASVTPGRLYGGLVAREDLPAEVVTEAAAFRHGRGEMQIHLALSEPPQWPDPALQHVAMLHVTPGLDATSQSVSEAERGLLPQAATLVVAQPVAIDPSRAPAGRWILWIQLQELPPDGKLKGDAAGAIPTPTDGRYTPEVREAYADRIVERLCRLIPNLRTSILGRHAISPGDLSRLNINLVGGDPYGGDCSLDQFLLWRPRATPANHETPIRGLHHIGASTHPGPGLGGMSGYLAARKIL